MRNDTQLPEHSPAPIPALDPSNLTVPSETPYLDANGYDVQHVGLYRSVDMTDIGAWLKREVLLQMSDWCNRRLPSAHELRMVSVDEVRIERHE